MIVAETLPWGATAGIIIILVGALVTGMKIGFSYFKSEAAEHNKRTDRDREAYLVRLDAKNTEAIHLVNTFNATVNTTLTEVCAQRAVECDQAQSFRTHVADEHAAMMANQAQVARVLGKIADKLDVSTNGKK